MTFLIFLLIWWIVPFMDHSLFVEKGLAWLNEAMSHAMKSHPRQMGHSEEFWKNVAHRRMRQKPTLVCLPGECYGLYQFSSVTQSCPTLCDPMNLSTPGLTVHHKLPEFTQTHVHWVGDAIQPSHPLSFPSPPAININRQKDMTMGVAPLQVRRCPIYSWGIVEDEY